MVTKASLRSRIQSVGYYCSVEAVEANPYKMQLFSTCLRKFPKFGRKNLDLNSKVSIGAVIGAISTDVQHR